MTSSRLLRTWMLFAAALLVSCGGGDTATPPTLSPQSNAVATGNGLLGEFAQQPSLKCTLFPSSCSTSGTITGIFVDGPTQGLTYVCSPSGTRGITDFAGHFICPAADASVDFTLAVGTSAIHVGSANVPAVTGVSVPVTQLLIGGTNVGLKAAEILMALNTGTDDNLIVGGIILPDAMVAQINAYITSGGVLPAPYTSDDQFLAAIQNQAGPLAFLHHSNGSGTSFLQNIVLPHLQNTVVGVSATNPAPAPAADGTTTLAGTIVISGNVTPNIAPCTGGQGSAGGGGVLNAVVNGDITKPGTYNITLSSPGFAESVSVASITCPGDPPVTVAGTSQLVTEPPYHGQGTITVTQAAIGTNLTVNVPTDVPAGCIGGNITGTNVGASNPLITLNMILNCNFGVATANVSVTAKLVGAW
jgi:hypothetical protein